MGTLGRSTTPLPRWGSLGSPRPSPKSGVPLESVSEIPRFDLCLGCNAVAFGMIETRLTKSKDDGQFIEVEGKKVALGIPGQAIKGDLPFVPLRRAGQPEEAAGGILFLASPYSSYITGHTLEVTGGAGI